MKTNQFLQFTDTVNDKTVQFNFDLRNGQSVVSATFQEQVTTDGVTSQMGISINRNNGSNQSNISYSAPYTLAEATAMRDAIIAYLDANTENIIGAI